MPVKRPQMGAERVAMLGGLLVSSVFGPGFQAVPVLTLVNLVLGLSLLDESESWADLALLLAVQTIGMWLAYLNIFGSGAAVFASLGLALAGTVVFGLFFAAPFRQLRTRFEVFQAREQGVMLTPVCFTAFFSIVTAASPTGSWANPAYAAVELGGMQPAVALFGLDGVNFMLAWAASLVFHALNARRAGADLADAAAREGYVSVGGPGPRGGVPRRALVAFLGTTAALLVFCGAYGLDAHGRFFQRNIEDWKQDRLKAVCLAGYSEGSSAEQRLAQTQEVVAQTMFVGDRLEPERADLVMWSEDSVQLDSDAAEDAFLGELGRIANESGTLIGVGYSVDLKHQRSGFERRNMFALLLADGTLGFKYQKIHPVIGVEREVKPGAHVVSPVTTAFGRIGAAICFDFDFPNTIRDAAYGAAIMLQPGWDWGPIGVLHARMDALRAVENGFTLIRCSSGGVSGVYDPYGGVVTETVLGTSTDDLAQATRAYTSYVPLHGRVRTLYSLFGGALGYLCFLAWLALLVLTFAPLGWVATNDTLARRLRPVAPVQI